MPITPPKITGFDWDEGNKHKNNERHNVEYTECEEAFFNQPNIVSENKSHSSPAERRYRLLGFTNARRLLTVIFTIRKTLVRVISARDQSKRERQEYQTHKQIQDMMGEK